MKYIARAGRARSVDRKRVVTSADDERERTLKVRLAKWAALFCAVAMAAFLATRLYYIYFNKIDEHEGWLGKIFKKIYANGLRAVTR